jgi:ribosomal protein S18 acetylase RimI-like enzyme
MASNSDNAIRLHVVEPDEAEILSELEARLFEQTFGPMNTPEDMREYLAETFSPAKQRAELEDPARTVWIVKDMEDACVGYVALRLGTAIDCVEAQCPAEVERIYVDRSLHGMSVGHRLMDMCVEHARSHVCDVLWLAVWERNPRAIAFYERRGFVRVGRKSFRLGNDVQQDYVMALRLT